MGLSLAFIPVVLFPMLRRVDEVLAIGYLIMRGAVETACYVVLAIGWLLLAPLGEAMSAGPGTASPAGVRLGSLMIDSEAPAPCSRSCSALVPSSSTSCSIGRASSPAGSRCGVSWRSRSTWPPTCSRCMGHRRQLHRAELAVRAPFRAGDGAGGLDDRARLPSGGSFDWTRTASSPKQPQSFLLGAARGPRVARARRIVMPLCGAGPHTS